MTNVAPRATYGEVFADPIFRVLFVTRSVAIAADTLRILALSVLVYAATGSPLWTAVTFGIVLLGVPVYYWAFAGTQRPDRHPHKAR